MKWIIPVFSSLMVLAPALVAQQTPVSVIVTVEARHGSDVPQLRREDFMAYQKKDRQRVTQVLPLQGEHAGLELFLLIDDNSSSSLGSQLEELRKFVIDQPATTNVAVGYMRNATVEIVQNFTADHALAARKLRLPLSSFGVMSSPWLSVSDLVKRWPVTPMRRELVLVASGDDELMGVTGSTHSYLDSAIEAAQRTGTVVYSIYTPGSGHAGHSMWRMSSAQSHLAQIAEETGGEAFMLGFGEPVSFKPYLAEIAERMTHQYRVTVALTPGNKAGLQSVKFATEVPNAELISAGRVWVPAGGNSK